jgi:hypothetical protein
MCAPPPKKETSDAGHPAAYDAIAKEIVPKGYRAVASGG